jgi:hypothetical protein
MEKMWVIKVIVFSILIQYLWALSANAQTLEVTGVSIKMLDNKKDIYHKKNKKVRQEMINEAVFDAIDLGASKRVSEEVERYQFSNSVSQVFEEYFDDYLSSSLIKTNVEWTRTSDYKFARIEGKNWKCEVTGHVRNLSDGDGGSASVKPKSGSEYYITRKSFNIVHINAGSDEGVEIGDKFLAFKYKRKKALTGINMKPKIVGLITVTSTEDSYSEGRILRGIYGVRESHQAKKYNFKKFRSGLEYQLAGSYEQVNTTEFGETESTVNSTTHSLFYYYYSYISRMGFKLGLEMMDIKKAYPATELYPYETDSSAYVFNPKFNLNYSIGLIPDFLFVVPNASIGYLFFENGKEEIFDRVGKAWDADVVLEADISAHLRLRSFDLVGGITFKYINDYPELKNYYPHVGIAYNFVRYAKQGLAGEE